ncbi:MAG: NAD(P)H-dependent oxidoreductase subunit E [Desulfobacula sp.]|jgi:NADH:ubiquinone oxidoreductase subunit E|uniref:NADH-quinone oxidoreductase subunit NuoE family protein n=1 Tax=Desulfobacula sp. TaxID=2593537 RepID=UPI001DFE221A|nr:NAD(P)H-dependent oxidoreductase subunit E [Desulfobacula sp.]MBT3486506.1 NAD(P)H-dependent oxidoreductase subunit E [Desulfobacula sp.]MBT3806422.1 NAD(P)H-dependent oxidoreductase subunit E [Desulfobacula sp.]MBT4023910.1 NAD(P)H-dependent oxidoreductase subunit E [Desulfobacula sp.]MBT4198964.1 NAD(P)H-dependent oxidoreductase subunit E [Desulfobacula sp.]
MDLKAVNEILSQFPEERGNLIGILHEVQNYFSYLPEAELRYISKKIDIPITQIYSVANFYNRFSLAPKGNNQICVCMGTACHVKGSEKIMNELQEKLQIQKGETTEDLLFSLDEVRCIGACGLAPAVVVNEDTHGLVKPKMVGKILSKYKP